MKLSLLMLSTRSIAVRALSWSEAIEDQCWRRSLRASNISSLSPKHDIVSLDLASEFDGNDDSLSKDCLLDDLEQS